MLLNYNHHFSDYYTTVYPTYFLLFKFVIRYGFGNKLINLKYSFRYSIVFGFLSCKLCFCCTKTL